MRKPTPLPPIELIEHTFSYEPDTGLILKHGKPIRNNDRTGGCIKVRVGHRTTQAARLAWLLFYREDPVGKRIVHLNGNPYDNRIENLQAKRI